MKVNTDEHMQTLKKIVAISIAGLAAALVATWKRVRTENAPPESEIAMEPGIPLSESPPEPPVSGSGTADAPESASADAVRPPSTTGVDAGRASGSSSRAELYEIARELEIEGRSKMNKKQLLAAIRAAN